MTDIQPATDERITELEQLQNAIDLDDRLEIMLTTSETAFYKSAVTAVPALIARIRADAEKLAAAEAALEPLQAQHDAYFESVSV